LHATGTAPQVISTIDDMGSGGTFCTVIAPDTFTSASTANHIAPGFEETPENSTDEIQSGISKTNSWQLFEFAHSTLIQPHAVSRT
jgi:hypothetical protein